MKNIVDGHFRALVSQLLQVENIPLGEKDGREGWLEIITSLSWEAATLLKPDMSRGGGMDPGGYVKVKCIASGCRSESMIVKGVVCKKNVAHRQMRTRIEKPRLMILGGALEYQRVSNLLSSFDTLLQQEMDHLKMAVAKIEAHHPNILLVEKSVSRFAQEYILTKDISLVLNIKRPLLERIARCTGAQIVPSVDHVSAQKVGHCDSFHVEKLLEEHGSAGQGGKKLTKTLMYFGGCPKPLGCTILLRGANGDELKKVKHVVQYGVFAAYHLALETSFLVDEGASLPELPLTEPLTVALPNKSLSIDRSISTVPGFTNPANEKQPPGVDSSLASNIALLNGLASMHNMELEKSLSLPVDCVPENVTLGSTYTSCFYSKPAYNNFASNVYLNGVSYTSAADESKQIGEFVRAKASVADNGESIAGSNPINYDPWLPGSRTLEAVAESAETSIDATFATEGVALEGPLLQGQGNDHLDEPGHSKEEFPPSPSDQQSILVSLSSRCVWKGTVCERSHLFRIKYYGNFDKPLGRFLQDHLLDQNCRCRVCEMPSEAHVQCYTHRQGTLTISVKKLPEILLPGEQEGKIWMWHRCLQCPRLSGFPPATRRVVMSDAAWGLSFGKFLELSLSNHAAGSRVASCGHSLHRDCLRFYGSGKMVACFRYASIDVHSVYLPPPKIDFNYEIQEWIQKEAEEVLERAELLFSEVLNTLSRIEEKISGTGPLNSVMRSPEAICHTAELEGVLQNERAEFEEMLRKILNREREKGQRTIDILEINRLHRQLLFQSYMWDHRLVYAASLDNNISLSHLDGSLSQSEANTFVNNEGTGTNMLARPSKGLNTGETLPLDPKLNVCPNQEGEVNSSANWNEMAHQSREDSADCKHVKEQPGYLSAYASISEPSDCLESGAPVRRALSDGEFLFMTNLSDTLDAAWTGKSQGAFGISKDVGLPLSVSVSADSSLEAMAEKLALENQVDEKGGSRVFPSLSPAQSLNSKASDNVEDTISWLGIPLLSFYRSLNKNFLRSAQKLGTLGGYNPIYVSSFQELELQSGARLLLPVGVNETVIPVYDDEPTSVISYALISQDYHVQLSGDWERPKETLESAVSLPLHDSLNFQSLHSLDESVFGSLGSADDSFLSKSVSHSPLITDPLFSAKSSHIRVSFSDNNGLDKVKYTVTFYYAKQFNALRKMCCPSELDFIRSLSRCKKWGAQGGKSNVFFAKTLDDRLIIKQVTKTELESFIKFGPGYFKYLTESTSTKSPTCLAKVLGIYQVVTKHLKGGKESKMDVLVMENLLFQRKVTRLYDLKGSSRSRYNPDSSGSNKVLLDQNLIEAMPTSPIFVGNKAKRLLERAVWNDTSFLTSVDVMDYSLLVGIDEEKHELVLGIIDFMRQYTWDKHLETWVKASGILGGPKNVSPTVISPKQYKKRFRKAMTTYFLMVPDQWSPLTITPSKSQPDLCEENAQAGGD
ncbi:1-phosphatidylinositol-3-phosphate 5-kinase fab1b [Ancistrocladus abbreviatus]